MAVLPAFVEHILSNTATGVHAIVTGDADHDGDMDVFAALESGERVMWYENNGARVPSFQEHTIATNFRIAHSISVSDLDNDGDLDVIATSRAGGQVAWFENVGGQYSVSQSPDAGEQRKEPGAAQSCVCQQGAARATWICASTP